MQDAQCVFPIGHSIRGRYVVEDLLGKGGFGAVYLVRDVREHLRPFALKEVIGPKRQEGHRFSSQAALLRRLAHPALPRVHEVFSAEQGERVYLLVDYIEGPDLESVRHLQPEKRFSLPRVMTLMAPVVQAVAYLHSQRPPLTHRDLKPPNIILPGAGRGVMLVDFGLAGAFDATIITGAASRGTPGYRAPAGFDGGGATRSDIYALGAILYLLLTGTVPADARDRLKKLGDGEPDPLVRADRVVPSVPAAVARAIHRALSLESDDSFSSVEQFWDALWLMSIAERPMHPAREHEDAAPGRDHMASVAEQGPAALEEATRPREAPVRGRMSAPGPALETGEMFERYRITRWLGGGGAGESYEAEDGLLPRTVTLKLICPQSALPQAARRQFFREMHGLCALDHPYLAPVLDFGEINGRLYVARRYTSSGSLLNTEGRLRFRPPLALRDAIHYGHQLAQALHYIHRNGYVHGALTFSNILVSGGPELEREAGQAPFLLADAGLASFVRRFGQQQQRAPLPFTAAPEQLGGRVTAASDQFALAAVLYFWLAGRPPYPGPREAMERLTLTETVAPLSSLNSEVSAEQDGVLLRALSARPEERYPSVRAFAEGLLGTLATEVQAVSGPERTAEPEFSKPTEPRLAAIAGPATCPDGKPSLEREPAENQLNPALTPQIQTPDASSTSYAASSPAFQTVSNAPQPLPEGLAPPSKPEPAATASAEEVTGQLAAPVRGRPSLRLLRKPGLQAPLFLLLFVTLCAGLGTGMGLWLYTRGHSGPAPALSATVHPSRIPSPAGPGPEVTATATHPATTSHLAGSYVGTIYDIAGSRSANMSLTALQQNQGNISGTFTGLRMTGTFSGTFSPAEHILFVIKDSAGRLIFSFEGDEQAGGELSGNYCSVDQDARCTGDYGLWSVAPAS